MIRIVRASCPNSLKSGKGNRYNRPDVVRRLFEMQHGKCCYCEQAIPKEGHQKAVEHFRPKSVFRGLAHEWANLLLVCAQCNGHKSDKFPVELTDNPNETKVVYTKRPRRTGSVLIDPSDPSDPNPESALEFVVDDRRDDWGLVHERHGNKRGRYTVDVTGIYLSFFVERRRDHWQLLMMQYTRLLDEIEKARRSGRAAAVRAAWAQLEGSASEQSEFSAFSRAFIKDKRIAPRVKRILDELGGFHCELY